MIRVPKIVVWAFGFLFFQLGAADVDMFVSHIGQGPGSKSGSIQVSKGQPFMVTVSVKPDDDELPDQEPEIIGSQDFKVGQASQGWSLLEVNGVVKNKSYDFHYYFEPLKEGKFKVGPVSCNFGDQIVESDVVQVSVAKAENVKDFFAKATISKDPSGQSDDDEKIFAGQKAWLSVKVFMNKNSFDYLEGMEIERPDTQDIEVGEPAQGFKQTDEFHGGKPFRAWERRYPIVPLKSGLLDISPFKIKYEISRKASSAFGFGSIFYRNANTGTMLTNDGVPLGIEVAHIPDNVAAVGRNFKVALGFERDKIKVGQPSVLALEIVGSGDFDKILHPDLNLPEQLRVYESKSENLQTSRNEKVNGFESRKRFEYIVQASKPGIYQIPVQEFPYFDTIREEVVVEKTRPLSFKVVADENEQSVASDDDLEVVTGGGQSSKAEQESMLAKKRAERLGIIGLAEDYRAGSGESGRGMMWIIFLIVLLVPLGLLFWREIHAWFEAKNRSRRACRRAVKEIDKACAQENLKTVYYVFLKYFSARFRVGQDSIDVDWINQKMRQISMSKSRIDDLFAFFNEAASLAFGRESHKYGPLEAEAFFKKAQHWVKTIDEYLKTHEEGKKGE